jgi:hypothetical protein
MNRLIEPVTPMQVLVALVGLTAWCWFLLAR